MNHKKKILVKILGDGELKHPLTIKAHAFSKSALKKIEKTGGKAEKLSAVPPAADATAPERKGR